MGNLEIISKNQEPPPAPYRRTEAPPPTVEEISTDLEALPASSRHEVRTQASKQALFAPSTTAALQELNHPAGTSSMPKKLPIAQPSTPHSQSAVDDIPIAQLVSKPSAPLNQSSAPRTDEPSHLEETHSSSTTNNPITPPTKRPTRRTTRPPTYAESDSCDEEVANAVQEVETPNIKLSQPRRPVGRRLLLSPIPLPTTDDGCPSHVNSPQPAEKRGGRRTSTPQSPFRARFNAIRDAIACPKCGAVGTLALNGLASHNRRMAICRECQKKTSGRQLDAVCITIDSSSPPILSPRRKRRRRNMDDGRPAQPSQGRHYHTQEKTTESADRSDLAARMASMEHALSAVVSRVDSADRDRSKLSEAIDQLTKSNKQIETLLRNALHQDTTTRAPHLRVEGQARPRIPTTREPRHHPIVRPTGVAVGPPTPTGLRMGAQIPAEVRLPPERGHIPIPAWIGKLPMRPRDGRSLHGRDRNNPTPGWGELVPESSQPALAPRRSSQPQAIDLPSSHPMRQTVNEQVRPSWASVAAQPGLPAINPIMRERILATRSQLAAGGFAPYPAQHAPHRRAPRPTPVAVYFAGVPRGPVGMLRRALLADHSLPKWALLAISFAGHDSVEILAHGPLVDSLTAVMQLLGYRLVRNYDPAAPHGSDRTEAQARGTPSRAAKACATRWHRCAHTTQGPAAKEWYQRQVEDLCKTFPALRNDLPEVDRPGETRGATNIGHNVPTSQPAPRTSSPQQDAEATEHSRHGGNPALQTAHAETQERTADGFEVVPARRHRRRNNLPQPAGPPHTISPGPDTTVESRKTSES